MPRSSRSRSSRRISRKPRLTPSASCHDFKSNSTRACFVKVPLTPASPHLALRSGIDRASSASFFLTTTSRRRAACARCAARAAASCPEMASMRSAFVLDLVSRPKPVASFFTSSMCVPLSSLRLAAPMASSLTSWASSPPCSSSSCSGCSASGSGSASCSEAFARERLKTRSALVATALRFWIAIAFPICGRCGVSLGWIRS
mmetsp:Transcript_30102/g.85923  ORF Transcript_30102/g.85923 Transcript_30102/m.85923 type:complete len:203 (+) Transcript_30102:602-1210(+)